MSFNYRRGETVFLEIEVVGVDSGISNSTVKIDHEDGYPILEETLMTEVSNQIFKYAWKLEDFNPPIWSANTYYSVGDQVLSTELNDYRYYCIKSGNSYKEEPETWIPKEDSLGNRYLYETPPKWIPTTSYEIGDEIISSVEDGRKYICTVSGISGLTEPSFNTTIGETTNDNLTEWICEEFDYCSWILYPKSIVPGNYNITYKATDLNSCVGIADTKIRIIE